MTADEVLAVFTVRRGERIATPAAVSTGNMIIVRNLKTGIDKVVDDPEEAIKDEARRAFRP